MIGLLGGGVVCRGESGGEGGGEGERERERWRESGTADHEYMGVELREICSLGRF